MLLKMFTEKNKVWLEMYLLRFFSNLFFRQLVDDLPMTSFIDNAMPHSLPILEAIYAKLNRYVFNKKICSQAKIYHKI